MNAVEIRRATREDVPAIVGLLADDAIGAGRESTADLAPYLLAFDGIAADGNQLLVVAVDDDQVIGTLQLTIIPGLSRRGALRGLIEAVRVHSVARGTGLGTRLIEWAVEESRSRGCVLVQLTSDKTRVDAHRFYTRLGFSATHEGFKLPLT